MSKNIFLTEEEWQQRMDEARREIAVAARRFEDAKRKLAEVVAERARAAAEREARDEREKA